MKVIVKQDVRVFGHGFSPGKKPIEVDDAIGVQLVKEGFAVPYGAGGVGGKGDHAGGNADNDAAAGGNADNDAAAGGNADSDVAAGGNV